MPRTVGSKVYMAGDPVPFTVLEPADVVIAKLEAARPSDFLPLNGEFTKYDEDGDVVDSTERSFYVRPRSVAAVAPFLRDEPEPAHNN